MYYWCTILPGPFFEYTDYKAFIERTLFKDGKIPAGSFKAFALIWARLVFVIAGVFLAFTYHPSFMWNDTEYAMSMDIFTRWALVMFGFACLRSSYYTGWLMSEAAVILSGFGFNGNDAQGNVRWDRLRNIDILDVEFGTSLKGMIAAWNKGTAHFLKVCKLSKIYYKYKL